MVCLKRLDLSKMHDYISLINGKFSKKVSVLDRGLSYGDGLFETMTWSHTIHDNFVGVEFWSRHLERLNTSCSKMKIEMPLKKVLEKYKIKILKKSLSTGLKEGILKIIITRGVGGRGYKFEKNIAPTIIFLSFPKVPVEKKFLNKGVNLKFCKSPIFINSQLAGIKHLNRIDSVMARSEWQSKKFFDGVLLDESENIIDGTMTNIFFAKNNILYTPNLNKCGINGIMRQVVIDKSVMFFDDVQEIIVNRKDFTSYNEMFITNSIIKVLPVKSLEQKKFRISKSTRNLMNYFQEIKNKVKNLELL